MKKFIVLSFVFVLFAGMVFAGAWRNYEDYQTYLGVRKAAQDAEAAGDTYNAVANYKKAAELAGKSASKDIQGWQLNNAAYVFVNLFKTTTGYAEKLAKLEGMQPSKEKLAYQKELADVFNAQMPVLEEAKAILDEGKGLGDDIAPAEKIKSNQEFIAWVTDFTSSNINGGTTEAKPPEEKAADANAETKTAVKAVKAAPKIKATAVIIKPVVTKAAEPAAK